MKLNLYENTHLKFTSTSWFRLITIGSNNYVKHNEYNINSIYTYKNEIRNK
jgi:hypothetical protein